MRGLGKSARKVGVTATKCVWYHVPAAVGGAPPLRSYASLIHRVVRSTAVRRQYFGTYFFRNRPQLRLIRDLANRRGRGSGLTLAFIGCSSGAELYSGLWTIRPGPPDLKGVAHAVDISEAIPAA